MESQMAPPEHEHVHSHDDAQGDGQGNSRDGGDEEQEGVSEEEYLKTYAKVAEIGKKVKAFAREVVPKSASLLQLAETLEAKIKEWGGEIAFPANLSRNGQAAHYTPSSDDETEIGEKDVLKVDLGVGIEGLMVDFAFTHDFSGENGKLVEAAEEAVQNALSVMKAGASTRDVGKEIEKTIKARGFLPVENLCGHLIEPYELHAGVEVPNVERGGYEFQEGQVFAVEPFASSGEGSIREGDFLQIFMVKPDSRGQVRLPRSRELLSRILAERVTMPFALRWYKDAPMLNLSIRDLAKNGVLEEFPVLEEVRKGSLVSQAETTVRIEKDGVEVLV